MKEDRRKRMEALIARRETVSMRELQEGFGVSMNTVRADVAYLVDTGAVEKIYGGVRIVRDQEVPLFTQRAQLRAQAKLAIARAAERRVQDGDVIYIDPGTTTMHLMDFLDPAKRVTVVTGSVPVIGQCSVRPNVELIVLPGALNRRTNSLSDVSTLEFLGRYRCTRAFMGATGISPEGKLNVSTYIEYELKKLAVRQSQHPYLLADAGKFGGESLMSYGALEDMEEVFTDSLCPEPFLGYCARHGVKLTIVEG